MALMAMPQMTKHRHAAPPARPMLDPGTLAQFVDPLPIPEIAKSVELRPSPDDATSTMTFASIVMELKRPPTVQLAGGPPCLNAYCPIGW